MPNETPTVPADGIDPNVKLPPNVVAAQARAAEAFATAYGGTGEGVAPPAGAPAEPPNGAAPVGEPPAPNGGTPPAHEEPGPELNADGSVNWENRFKALKGRFDAEQRRSRETIEQFEARMRELRQDMQTRSRQPLPGEGTPPQLVTEKDVADYGADLIDVIRRTAQETILPILKPIAETVGHVQARVDTTASETERQFLHRMHSTMDVAVPGWNELNTDPNFIAWTKRNDVYSGQNRQELLQKAWYAGDSNRVAAFFQGYLAEEAAIDPAAAEARQRARAGHEGHAPPAANGSGQPAPTGQPPAAPRVTLEQLAAPGRARAGATPPAGKSTWTAAGISQFYIDVANGKFRGREAERAATEADLMAAQREGRIQVNPRTATHVSR
jgi:hypothetical protein